MVNGENGNICPLCRKEWFCSTRTFLWRKFRDLAKLYEDLRLFIWSLEPKFSPRLWFAMRVLCNIMGGTCYDIANNFITRYSDLYVRNPYFHFNTIRLPFGLVRSGYGLARCMARFTGVIPLSPIAYDSAIMISMSILAILCDSIFGLHGELETLRDHCTVAAFLVLGFVLSHLGHFWTLGCCYMNLDPLWPTYWAEERWNCGLGLLFALFLGTW